MYRKIPTHSPEPTYAKTTNEQRYWNRWLHRESGSHQEENRQYQAGKARLQDENGLFFLREALVVANFHDAPTAMKDCPRFGRGMREAGH